MKSTPRAVFRCAAALGVALSLVSATEPQAEDVTPLWRKVGVWQIRIDNSMDRPCFMVGNWTSGTVVRLGLYDDDDAIYLAIGNNKWKSVRDGQTYSVQFSFDDEAPWTVSLDGDDWGGAVLLSTVITQKEFLWDFAKRNSVRITFSGKPVANLQLTDSFKAVSELIACDQANISDPFRSGSSDPFQQNSSDPFAN